MIQVGPQYSPVKVSFLVVVEETRSLFQALGQGSFTVQPPQTR